MTPKQLSLSSLLITALLTIAGAGKTNALTLEEFKQVCTSANMPCRDIPILQAYVGGALDLVAVLDEKTPYLEQIYCKPTAELFKVGDIIDYMETLAPQYGSDNAMVVVVKYLEEKGGCQN